MIFSQSDGMDMYPPVMIETLNLLKNDVRPGAVEFPSEIKNT
jgi:hypothetical protein